MGKYLTAFLVFSIPYVILSQERKLAISGTVQSDGKHLSDVNVLINSSTKGAKTDREGHFFIQASPKDTLNFSYIGMESVETVLSETSTFLDIQMIPKLEELEEVTVKKRRRKTQKDLLADYVTNKNLIKTSWGIIDPDRSSFSMRVIDGKDLAPGDFLSSIQVHYPIMVIDRTDVLEPKAYLQQWGREKIPVIYDVDGFVYEKAPTFIDVREIDRITVLARNAAFSRYGPQGIGGVIIVNTKAQIRMDGLGTELTYDQLRDGLYEPFAPVETYVPENSEYIKELQEYTTENSVFAKFEEQENRYKDSPYYFLEVSDYFSKHWKNEKKAKEILYKAEESFSGSPNFLKALAYVYEEQGELEKALGCYLKVLKQRSREAQSFRDVANAYNLIGNYRKGLGVYVRYKSAINELDSVAFDANNTDILMTTESDNILALRKAELKKIKELTQNTIENPSVRVVFEWSDPEAQFEILFEAPNEMLGNWDNIINSKEGNFDRERSKGYTSKQFFLDDALKGEWNVNFSYMGNGSADPTYIKCSIYFDYGLPTQKVQLKVIRFLDEINSKRLYTIDTSQKTVLD